MDSEGENQRRPDDESAHPESTTIPPPSDLSEGAAGDLFAASDTQTASDVLGEAGPSAVLIDARVIRRRTAPLETGADSSAPAESAGFSLDTDIDIEAEAQAEAGAEAVAEAPGATPAELSRTVRFKVEARLGAGGMGVVYRAHDRERGEVVALKTMRRIDPKTLYRFKHEFRSLADLSHPNLVNLYELVASGGHWFFTMELVEGVDFVTYVRAPSRFAMQAAGTAAPAGSGSGEALEPDQIERLRHTLRQLAAAIAALHEVGKLHRDIKPTNVLVTSEGRVVVLDFGLVADVGPSGQLQSDGEAVVGTVAYMAPEQTTVQPVARSCDWYSVGVMLFVALTGRLPFEGRPRSVLAQKRTCEAPRASAFAPGVPDDLDTLCADLLRRDPAARPSDQDILARLAAAVVPSGPAPGGAGVPLIGRERHFEVLRSAFVSVRSGRPEVVLVSGRSGSGKSTLIQAFLDDLIAGAEAVVLSGRCYERESVPYKALDSVVDALSRYLKPLPDAVVQPLLPRDLAHLARVFPVLNRVDAVASAPRPEFEIPDQQELRRRAFAALRTLLANIGQEKPLVVAIDDLQWADPENAPLVMELVRPPDPPRMLLLGSFRTEDVETSAFLRALLGTDSDDSSRLTLEFQELSVGALRQEDARALALALLGRDDAITRAEAHLVARESRGNPFFLDELVKHIQAGGGLAHRSVAAGAITLDEVLWARVGRLTDDARRLLGIVAVSARPIDLRVAFQAAGFIGGSAGRAAVGLLRTSRLIRAAGPARRDAIEVYHDRIRETVLAQLAGDQVQEYHLRLAETLEVTAGADPESLALQFQGAAQFAKAERYFGLAADRAAGSLAFDHAARLYRRALELGGTAGRDRALLNRRLGDALANAGRGGEAARAYLAAAPGASVAGALELKRRATMQLIISGRVDEGFAALRSVLAALGMALPRTPRRSLAWLIARRAWLRLRGYGFERRDTSQLSAEQLTRIDLCWSAASGLSIIDPISGAEFQARGLLLALKAGEPYRVARALALEAMHVATAGSRRRPQVAALIERAQTLTDECGHPHAHGLVPLARATTALLFGNWRQARESFDRAEAIFRDRCTGVAWELDTAHNLALWATTHMGDLATLQRRWPVLLQEAQGRGDLYAITTLNTFFMALLRLADDDPDGARRELAAVMGRWSHRGFHIQHGNAVRAEVHVDLYCGSGAAAWARMRQHWGAYRRSQLLRVQMLRIEQLELRGRSALAAARTALRPGPLLRAAARDAGRLEREHEPWARAHAQLLRAGIATVRGDRRRAVAGLYAAAAQFETLEMHLHAAACRRRLGELLVGAPGEALINEADQWMRKQTIRDPARMTSVYAPGLTPSSGSDEDSNTSSKDSR
jgi:serine/threonine protein kinase/tetratricopeptide (TPR) repeat protein